MNIVPGSRGLKIRRILALAITFLAWSLPAETLTMAAQRDDPELFALFVKTYRDAGIELRIEVLPALRCVSNVRSGEMIGYLFSDVGLAEYFTGTNVVRVGFGTEPIFRFKGYAWVRASEVGKWKERARWPGARVGVLMGVPVIRQLGELTGSTTFVEVPLYGNIAKMLEADRFDIFVAPVGNLDLLSEGLNVARLDEPIGEVAYWHVLPAKLAGTPTERRIRDALLANRPAFERLLQDVLAR